MRQKRGLEQLDKNILLGTKLVVPAVHTCFLARNRLTTQPDYGPAVMVSTTGWQLRGYGRVPPLHEAPPGLVLSESPQASGCVLVEIRPFQLQINQRNGWGYAMADLKKLPRTTAKALMVEACKHASLKMAQIESMAHFRQKIRGPA